MDDATDDQTPTLPSALSGVGGALAGRYQLRARLGRGATKEVYLAYDTRLDREVALAIVVGAADNDIARARVEREAQVTGRLGDHPNVITVYDSGEQDGVPYLVLRAMPGGSLADRVRRARPSIEQTIRLGREIALALAHAHEHGVVHRDVKPDNVWLAADGSAALGDFGIAQQAGAERLTAEGVVLGTVRYLSPEQIRGADVGPASDLYALGVTLYELATGRPPFQAADPTQVLTQHLTAVPVPPSHVEPAVAGPLERLILDLLAKDPEQRPPSAGAVAAALAGMGPATGVPPAPIGAAPAPAPPTASGARRLVAVLAAGSDVGDPEALHAVFGRAGAIIERHGGTVERYLGDELVGFFGLTASHGDDAQRAARAAIELREAAPGLRLGIESGELFLDTGPRGETIATGAAIKVAGRLADAAQRGEIRLGESARAAFGAEATIDAPTGRLVELHVDEPALLRVSGTPFVGRTRELATLRAEFDAAREDRACRLVTVAGAPGVGKSRLAGELLAAVGDEATVLAGRCLAYGEGTTYRALADIVRGLGDDPAGRVEELLAGDARAVRGILGAVGLSDEPAQPEETSLALRRLLERLARDRPLVVAVEDIHWAQPALLDLLDHVVALSSGAAILLVCLTRPELLDARPEWAAPQPNRSLVVLDALGEAQAVQLAQGLGAGELAARIARRAEGNPLFVEQLVAVDTGQDTGELPVSIQAVLAARIDRLEPGERTLLQRAAVEGRTFHAGAVAASLPEHEQRGVGALLVALARKGLVRADRPEFVGEDAFHFSHALIREAAYAGLPKVQRAALHAGVADWLGRRTAADEIVGYHLEHAWHLRAELGHAGEAERSLAARAVSRLQAASASAFARADAASASTLLERALALADDLARGTLRPALGASLFEAGRMTDALRVLDEAIADAPTARLEARARVEREFVRLETEAGADTLGSRRIADAALPLLERDGDDQGVGRVWSLRAQVAWLTGQIARADEAWCQAAECVRRAGGEREVFNILRWRATAAVLGPTPVGAAIARCEDFRRLVAASPSGEAWTFNALAVLHAMEGNFERAGAYIRDAGAIFSQFGSLSSAVSHHAAHVKLLAGEPAQAEELLRGGVKRLEPMGDSGLLATKIAMLAQAVYAQGRAGEAAELCEKAAAMTPPDDVITQVIWHGVKAKALARGGSLDRAEALARAAVALIEPTDLLTHHGDALLDLAEVLNAAGRGGEAAEALRRGLDLYEAKENATSAAVARSLLGERRAGEAAPPAEGSPRP